MLRKSVTDADSVIRWGGEEFMIILESRGLLTSWIWAERLRESISHMVIPGGHRPIKVTASMGLKEIDGDIDEFEIESADTALYLAKHGGRNRVCTDAMVTLQADLVDLQLDESSSVLGKRRKLLDRVKYRIGPTQWEHITDHCERVSETAVAIAQELGFERRTIERLRIAGLLHDIGKLVIPESLLSMPRSLMHEEWRLMHQHETCSTGP